jgi:hypothetical protein
VQKSSPLNMFVWFIKIIKTSPTIAAIWRFLYELQPFKIKVKGAKKINAQDNGDIEMIPVTMFVQLKDNEFFS